jgi:ADP-ribosyl-[dinitrogen reductase] hydrolase
MTQVQININHNVLSRAQGCLLGQLAGDALGSLVEFQTPEKIRREYPDGVRNLADGGTWDTIAGQPTDDSEMALLLAHMLADQGGYDPEEARKAYVFWLDSGPFDCGMTVSSGLRGRPNPESQANGAMMRISPLGIFGANHDLQQVAEWAKQDAALTHPHPVCRQANALFTMAVAHAIRTGIEPRALHEQILVWANEMSADDALMEAITGSTEAPPTNYVHQQGWVLIAFRNALWQLRYSPNLEEAVVDTVMRGGDTDTNAAICGALLGAVWGRDAIPAQWTECLLNCRPVAGQAHVARPRPECFWPVDALELAERLVTETRGKNG